MVEIGLGERHRLGGRQGGGGAARRGAVVEIAEAALGRLADDRLHHGVGGDETRAHEIGDPGIALEAAEVPVQPVDILLRRQAS